MLEAQVFEKSYEASERARRLDEESAADRRLHEGEPPAKSLGERLRGWWNGRHGESQTGDGDETDGA
jgi:hypothetical protein